MVRVYGMKVICLTAGGLTNITETMYEVMVEIRFIVSSQPRA